MTDAQRLRDRIIELGPWHLPVQVTPEVSTAVWEDEGLDYPDEWGNVRFRHSEGPFKQLMRRIYGDDLNGRSVLDCACNCGAFLFWAKDLGAGRCFGFDIRDHWIKQARFLLEHRQDPDVTFEVRDLYDLPNDERGPFDVTIFRGILYHLPDPISGLQIAADMTSELLIIDTATTWDDPDGFLRVKREGTKQLMSGVYELSWFPTGPQLLERMLAWLGFVETRLTYWVKTAENRGRLEMVASKVAGLLPKQEDLAHRDVGLAHTGEFRTKATAIAAPRPGMPT